MKCEECDGEMVYDHKHERGRHVREVYRCAVCGLRQEKKISVLRYNGTKDLTGKGCSVPWGKDRRAKTNPRKKKRR